MRDFLRVIKENSLDSSASMEVTIQKVMDQWELFRIQRRKERRLRERWKCFYLGKKRKKYVLNKIASEDLFQSLFTNCQ